MSRGKKMAVSERHLALKNLGEDFRRKAEIVEREIGIEVRGREHFGVGGLAYNRYQDAVEKTYKQMKEKNNTQ